MLAADIQGSIPLTIPEAIASSAEVRPGNAALICPHSGQGADYRALTAQIFRTGRLLADLGIGHGDRIAVIVDGGVRSASLLISLASHVAVAPLSGALTAREIAGLINRLQISALVIPPGVSDSGREAAKSFQARVLEIDVDELDIASFTLNGDGHKTNQETPTVSENDTALFLQTSGTTGRPKTVALTHRQLILTANQLVRSFGLTSGDKVLNPMPLFHVHGFTVGLLSPLISGGAAIAPTRFDQQQFLEWGAKHAATWYTGAPTLHQTVVAEARANPTKASLCNFRFIRSATAALPEVCRADLSEIFRTPILEGYGMTEACGWIAHQVPGGSLVHGSVGKPQGVEVAIGANSTNETGQSGSVGEILIRGDNVITEYWDDEEATSQTFIDGWLRTGDLGRFDETGRLYVVGRSKEMVKRGGFQVTPMEVEDALLSLPSISEAAAFGVDHETLGQDLVAAVVSNPPSNLEKDEIRTSLFDILAAYKIPSRVIVVDQIPKGQTGKIQRTGLAEFFREQIKVEYVAPSSTLEAILCEMVSEVLPIRRLGVADDFFLSGGDSLSGARYIGRIRKTFGVDLPIEALFSFPTVRSLANHLELVDHGRIIKMLEESLVELDKMSSFS